MTHQLSNRQTELTRVTLFFSGIGLPFFIAVFLILGGDNLTIIAQVIIVLISLVVGLSILHFSTHLCNVTFDRNFIYLSRLGKIEKINIEKIEEIRPGSSPFRLYYSNAYIVTITYFDNDKKYEVKFLSKGATGLHGTVDNIPFLDTLRQFIKDKKYK